MTPDTRQVALAFLEDVAASGMHAGARRHAAADIVWWLPGSSRDEALRGKDEVVAWFEERGNVDQLFHEPPEIVVERVLVEGNDAAAQIRAQGSTRTGKRYDNRYVFVMTVENGQITELREFFDTLHVRDTFH